MRKQFYKYVIPSVLAFALSGVYAIVDGFFIGNSVGDIGLAAINIAYPITALIQSIGTGIGIGGSVELSVNIGKNDVKAQKSYISKHNLHCNTTFCITDTFNRFRCGR